MSDFNSFTRIRDQLRLGDEAAAREVFRRFTHRLVALARHRLSGKLQQKVDPEDIAQSVLKSFFVGGAAAGGDFRRWDDVWALLLVMTVRKCARRARRFGAKQRDLAREHVPVGQEWTFIAGEPTPDQAAALGDLLERLMASLDAPIGRPTLTMMMQGYTPAEIAEQLDVSERTIYRFANRIREKMLELEAED